MRVPSMPLLWEPSLHTHFSTSAGAPSAAVFWHRAASTHSSLPLIRHVTPGARSRSAEYVVYIDNFAVLRPTIFLILKSCRNLNSTVRGNVFLWRWTALFRLNLNNNNKNSIANGLALPSGELQVVAVLMHWKVTEAEPQIVRQQKLTKCAVANFQWNR